MTDRIARRDGGRRARRLVLGGLAAALAMSLGGCVIIKTNSSTQLSSIGNVEITTRFCASDTSNPPNNTGYSPTDPWCQKFASGGNANAGGNTGNDAADNFNIQLKIAYRIPTNVTAPSTITTTEPSGGSAFTFSQNASYTSQLTSLSPPGAGKQWVGYLSSVKNYTTSGPQYFTVAPQFTLQQAADGSPFQGPFDYQVVVGYRQVDESTPGNTSARTVTCGGNLFALYTDGVDGPDSGTEGDMTGVCVDDPSSSALSSDLSQATRDLGVVAGSPQSAQAGAQATVPFTLKYRGSSSPSFNLSASSNLPGSPTVTPSQSSITPGTTLRDWYFKKTTANTSSNCGTATRKRDMEEGYAGSDPEETFNRSTGGATHLRFCSPAFSAGDTLVAGTTTVTAWTDNTAGSGCGIRATLYKNSGGVATSLGNVYRTVPQNSGITQRTWTFSNSGTDFAAGDRLMVSFNMDEVKACDSTDIHYGGTAYRSNVQLPGPVGSADSDTPVTGSVTVPPSTPPGTYNITFTATGTGEASGQVRSNTNTVTVGEAFGFSPAPDLPSLGTITLNAQAQTETATMPNFGVIDSGSSPQGWNVTVVGDNSAGKSNVFKQYCPGPGACGSHPAAQYVSGGFTLPANSLTLNTTGASWSGGTGTAPSFQCGGGCFVDRSAAIKIASAPNGGGTALWTTSGFGATSLSLATPSTLRALPAAEQYRVDIVWTLGSGP